MEMAYGRMRIQLQGPVYEIPEGIKNIIFFDEEIYPYIKSPRPVERIVLEKGYSLYLFRITGERKIKLDLHNLEIL